MLKKHKKNTFFSSVFSFSFCFVIFSLIFSGCKSLPEGKTVEAIDLIDDKSQFYISIPKDSDPDFLKHVISAYSGLSEEDSEKITKRIDVIYAGINKNRKSVEIQAAVEAEIPVRFVSRILTKKNGWTKTEYFPKLQNQQIKNSKFDIYKNNSTEISFFSENIAVLGRNIFEMADQFVKIENESSQDVFSQDFSKLPLELRSYLKNSGNQIRFYSDNPISFLTVLSGTKLNLQLFSVNGFFVKDENVQDQYFLDLTFNFKNSKFLKAGKSLLNLAFGLSDSQAEILSENVLTLHSIKISREQLLKILSI